MKPVNTDQALINAIDQLLSEYPTGLREMELIDLLDQRFPSIFPKPDLSDSLLLFQHHFMLRHCLYVLQQQLADSNKAILDITPVTLCKRLYAAQNNNLPAETDSVRDYYLDLTNLAKESPASVERLLNDFWQALARYTHQPQALKILGLTGDESDQQKKARYKQLVQKHHPDKGGDAEEFHKIQQAWEDLTEH